MPGTGPPARGENCAAAPPPPMKRTGRSRRREPPATRRKTWGGQASAVRGAVPFGRPDPASPFAPCMRSPDTRSYDDALDINAPPLYRTRPLRFGRSTYFEPTSLPSQPAPIGTEQGQRRLRPHALPHERKAILPRQPPPRAPDRQKPTGSPAAENHEALEAARLGPETSAPSECGSRAWACRPAVTNTKATARSGAEPSKREAAPPAVLAWGLCRACEFDTPIHEPCRRCALESQNPGHDPGYLSVRHPSHAI